MMFRKISLFASLLFFLVGTNVYANSHLEDSSKTNGAVLTEPATTVTPVEESPADAVNTTKVPAVKQSGKEIENTAILNNKAETQPSLISYIVPGAVAILLFFGFGSYWLIFRRKHV